VARTAFEELRRGAYHRIDALEKEAKHAIERASLEIQTKLLADGPESAEAQAFLAAMPAAEQLTPPVSIAEVKQPALPRSREV
jgi:hypothetical protein